MADPVVSVVMPVYNGERFVAAAIESVLAQTLRSIEVLIVNDGSTDRTHDVVAPYLADPRVHYTSCANGGVAAARNRALRQARGELVAFIDHDDLWLPTKLEEQVAVFSEKPALGLLHTAYALIDADGNSLGTPDFGQWTPAVSGHCFKELFIRNRIALLTAMVRRSFLEDVGGFNETAQLGGADEYELWLKLSHRYDVDYLNKILALYRMHTSNASNSRLKMELAELSAVDSALQLFPTAVAEVGRDVVDARLYELCLNVARYQGWLARDQRAARRYFLRALRHKPTSPAALAGLCRSAVPIAWSNAARWYARRFTQMVVGRGN